MRVPAIRFGAGMSISELLRDLWLPEGRQYGLGPKGLEHYMFQDVIGEVRHQVRRVTGD